MSTNPATFSPPGFPDIAELFTLTAKRHNARPGQALRCNRCGHNRFMHTKVLFRRNRSVAVYMDGPADPGFWAVVNAREILTCQSCKTEFIHTKSGLRRCRQKGGAK